LGYVYKRPGLNSRGRSAQLRPSRLQGTQLKQASDWLAGYSRFWEKGFDRMDARIKTAKPRKREK
jgi:hypothetical protein